MQKIYIISCCAECPSYKVRKENSCGRCRKQDCEIEGDSENPINPALTGFPDWCPLETVVKSEIKDYREEVKQILAIIKKSDSYSDALQEVSHYLNSVIVSIRLREKTSAS